MAHSSESEDEKGGEIVREGRKGRGDVKISHAPKSNSLPYNKKIKARRMKREESSKEKEWSRAGSKTGDGKHGLIFSSSPDYARLAHLSNEENPSL